MSFNRYYLSNKQIRYNWDLQKYMDWLDPKIERLMENQEKNYDKIINLTLEFGEFLFDKWFQMKYQPLGRNGKLEFWQWWIDWYQIDFDECEYYWYNVF